MHDSFLSLGLFFGRRLGPVFQDVPRLAVEVFADCLQRGEADGSRLAGFEDGEIWGGDVHAVGEVVQTHFALGEDHVEIDDDGHKFKPSIPVLPESSGLRP